MHNPGLWSRLVKDRAYLVRVLDITNSRSLQKNNRIVTTDTIVIRSQISLRQKYSAAKRSLLTKVCNRIFGCKKTFATELQPPIVKFGSEKSQPNSKRLVTKFRAKRMAPKICNRYFDRQLVADKIAAEIATKVSSQKKFFFFFCYQIRFWIIIFILILIIHKTTPMFFSKKKTSKTYTKKYCQYPLKYHKIPTKLQTSKL